MIEILVKESLYLETTNKDVIRKIKDDLTINNPDHIKRLRLKKWLGNIPKFLNLYEVDENIYILPFGYLSRLEQFLIQNNIKYSIINKNASVPLKINKTDDLNLYDYQQEAVDDVLKHDNGILISPAGSGKTRMAMEIIGKRNQKTLWLTNNLTLLAQSKRVFKQFYNNKVGEISGGKVNIQEVTFATVQTLSNVDLTKYKDTWGMIVVDEVHRVAGGPTKVMQFYKVLSNLNAKYKYGITATLFEQPKDISMTPIFLIGEKLHEVSSDDIERVTAKHILHKLHTKESDEYLNPDKTIDYNKLLDFLINDEERNINIVSSLFFNKDRHNLVLSSRNEHLKTLSEYLNNLGVKNHVLIGTTKNEDREEMLEDFKQGKVNFILSNYQLAKEGLDLPIADTLHMVLPMREKKTIIQSAGRVERTYPGKVDSKVYDYVDMNHFMLVNMYKDRRRHLNAR